MANKWTVSSRGPAGWTSATANPRPMETTMPLTALAVSAASEKPMPDAIRPGA
jgi:hypothetical protein